MIRRLGLGAIFFQISLVYVVFVMDYYGHKLSNGVLFAHHLILDVPGGSSHLGYRRRVPPGHYPTMGVKYNISNEFVRTGRHTPSRL